MNKESKISSHCQVWTLSDLTNTDLQEICQHDHAQICEDCDRLQSTLEDVQKVVIGNHQANTEELLHEIQNGILEFQYWNGKKHILWIKQLEYGKNTLKEMINESTVN